MRKVLLHYHFFKNAGTSIDLLLDLNFPQQWVSKEFDSGIYTINAQEVSNWINQESSAVAFSSHTAILPVPDIVNTQVFPIVFFRHPIDRIASAYAFEHDQKIETKGTLLARSTDLKGYIEAHLKKDGFSQCRNFHISRLKYMINTKTGIDAQSAINAVERLPFVGIVECYEQSINRLVDWLLPHFPSIKPVIASKNVTRQPKVSLDQKLEQIRLEVGDDCYAKLLKANDDDIKLYQHLKQKYIN